MTYPIGHYRYRASDGFWYSGSNRGPYAGVVTPPPPPPPAFYRFAPGELQPIGFYDAGTTNIGPQGTLTQYNGDISIATGQTVTGLDIYGKVTFTGTGTLVDCIVRGPATSLDPTAQSPTSDCTPIIGTGNDLKGSLISRVRIDCNGRENPWKDGIRGGNFTMEYSEIVRSNDGHGAMAVGNATIKCSRISRGYYTAWLKSDGTVYPGNPPSPSDRTSHCDCVQVQGYSGWLYDGCYVGGTPGDSNIDHQVNRDWAVPAQRANILTINTGTDYTNACFMIQNNVGAANPVGCIVRNCWLAGGSARFNISPTAGVDMLGGVQILNNRIIRPTWTGNYVGNNILNNGSSATITGNVFDDTGLAVPIIG